MAPLCQLPLLMTELPDMPDRVAALRLRPASCLLCGMQTVTCLIDTARIQGGTGTASACCCMGVTGQVNILTPLCTCMLLLQLDRCTGQALEPCPVCRQAEAVVLTVHNRHARLGPAM